MAVRNFPKCEVGRSVGPQYYTLFSYTPLRYVRNVARNFGHATCFRSQLFVFLPNVANVSQAAAELLGFVEIKMVVSAILDFV